MPSNPKFPPTVEIKRAIAAAIRAGIEIGSVEIYPDKIVIHHRAKDAPAIADYDIWKMGQRLDTERISHTDENTEAPVTKPRG